MRLFASKPVSLRSVLFICTANVTRSPAAAAFFKKTTEQAGEKWETASAGVRTDPGMPPNPIVAFILEQRGMKISKHRSRPVTVELLKRHRWIIVMEKAHRRKLMELAPELQNRIFLMRELLAPEAARNEDLADPTTGGEEDYRKLLDTLNLEIPSVFRTLQLKVSDLTAWSCGHYSKGRGHPD